jgi:hypothetical protein
MGVRMRIFVAYGYNSRDKWIEDSIQPVIEAFGSEFVHGADLGGQVITEGVRALIDSSDGLLAFATTRDAITRDQFTTHRWVTDELAYAVAQAKQVVEIREDGVLDQGGIAGDRQRITFREDDRLRCLVEVVKTLGGWHRRITRRFQLVPNDLVRPHLSKAYFRCKYRVLEGGHESLAREVPVQRIQGGLFFSASGLTATSLLQVEVVTDQKILYSDFTSVDSITVQISE